MFKTAIPETYQRNGFPTSNIGRQIQAPLLHGAFIYIMLLFFQGGGGGGGTSCVNLYIDHALSRSLQNLFSTGYKNKIVAVFQKLYQRYCC